MATKAELFRYLSERSGAKRPKQAKRKAGPAEPKRHNLSLRTDRHAGYTYEEAAPGQRPSRKSTRKSENRQKTDVLFRKKQSNAEMAPRPRAARARGR
jgi:hypothetical protein